VLTAVCGIIIAVVAFFTTSAKAQYQARLVLQNGG
jgi:hypothetical protein